MEWDIPGTVLRADRREADQVEKQFSGLFQGGSLVLSQVSALTGLEPYCIQNWVKRGFLAPPQKKRYTLPQLCRIISINMLKNVLSLDEICTLLQHVNGSLDDTSDDMIDDSVLYFMFVRLAARIEDHLDPAQVDAALEEELRAYREPVPGAAQRVKAVLRVMLAAWQASVQVRRSREMLNDL